MCSCILAVPRLTCGMLIPRLVVRCIGHRPSRMRWYFEIGPIWSHVVSIWLRRQLVLREQWLATPIHHSYWLTSVGGTCIASSNITDMLFLSRPCRRVTWPDRTFRCQWNFNIEVGFWKRRWRRRRRLMRRPLSAKRRIDLAKGFVRICKLFSQTSILGYKAFDLRKYRLFHLILLRQVSSMRCEACYLCCQMANLSIADINLCAQCCNV